MKLGFFIVLGSNLQPQVHFPRMVAALAARFGTIWLSRVLHTAPRGMATANFFLNGIAYLETDLNAAQVKQICNQLEESLGRDRTDPDKKNKDRTADFDIVYVLEPGEKLPSCQLPDDPYLTPCLAELAQFTGRLAADAEVDGQWQGVTALVLEGRTIGTRPCAIRG